VKKIIVPLLIVTIYLFLISLLIFDKYKSNLNTLSSNIQSRFVAIEEILESGPITDSDLWRLLSFLKTPLIDYFSVISSDEVVILKYGQSPEINHSTEINVATATVRRKGVEQFSVRYHVNSRNMVLEILKEDRAYITVFSLLMFISLMLIPIINWLKRRRDEEIFEFLATSSDSALIQKLVSKDNTIAKISGRILDLLNDRSARESESAMTKKTAELARQVSHDIRSPLSALNMLMKDIDLLPETHRFIMRTAIGRINDISNQLLQRGKSANTQQRDAEKKSIMISAIIDSLVSEKRIQYREFNKIFIETSLDQSYGLFVQIGVGEFERVLSNLINNSVESMRNGEGRIKVIAYGGDNRIHIEIHDNGVGIPSHILPQLGNIGVSFGKEGTSSGSGLGLHHAKQVIETLGGNIQITSTVNIGTTVSVVLPKDKAPEWFFEKLILTPNLEVVALDDDQSIHEIWKGRLASAKAQDINVRLVTFSNGRDFEKYWHTSHATERIALIDYELLGQNETGLDLIDRLKIAPFSVLVTSRYEESHIRESCHRLQLKLLPKTMASIVPISIILKKSGLQDQDIVKILYLDDDELMRKTWEISAKSDHISLITISSPTEFSKIEERLSKAETKIYLDHELGDGEITGKDFAQTLRAQGYQNLFLSTGHDADIASDLPWLRVVKKGVPWGKK